MPQLYDYEINSRQCEHNVTQSATGAPSCHRIY